MNQPLQEDIDFLEHFGVKGQKWGVRREIRKAHFGEADRVKKINSTGEKSAKKDPSFKEEVKATRKRQGISGATGAQKTKDGLITGRLTGDFKDSKGKPVSEDFANAVLKKAVDRNARAGNIATGALVAANLLLIVGAVKMGR